MEPSIVIHDLRTRGLYPAVADGSVRLYGDMRHLTGGLRQAIRSNRAGIIKSLQRSDQSIAYDILDIASCAGWHPTITGDVVVWRRGPESSRNPMPTQTLRDALSHHIADVIAVLRTVPAGCTNRTGCQETGICAAEIRESTCYKSTTDPLQHSDIEAAPNQPQIRVGKSERHESGREVPAPRKTFGTVANRSAGDGA